MKELLRPKKNKENKGDEAVLQFRKNTDRENNLVKEAEPRREKRAKTIFGKNWMKKWIEWMIIFFKFIKNDFHIIFKRMTCKLMYDW